MTKAEAKVTLSSWWLRAALQMHSQQPLLLRVGLWCRIGILGILEKGERQKGNGSGEHTDLEAQDLGIRKKKVVSEA